MSTLVVKLENECYPGSGGTVIAKDVTVAEYLAMIKDRDGAHNLALRLWEGEAEIGDTVRMWEPTPAQVKAQFEALQRRSP